MFSPNCPAIPKWLSPQCCEKRLVTWPETPQMGFPLLETRYPQRDQGDSGKQEKGQPQRARQPQQQKQARPARPPQQPRQQEQPQRAKQSQQQPPPQRAQQPRQSQPQRSQDKLGGGSNSADGNSRAPGRDMIAGSRIALAIGRQTIARGHSGESTEATTSLRIASVYISPALLPHSQSASYLYRVSAFRIQRLFVPASRSVAGILGRDWYDSDDVYIDYDDGYYLYNRRYPQIRLAITVIL